MTIYTFPVSPEIHTETGAAGRKRKRSREHKRVPREGLHTLVEMAGKHAAAVVVSAGSRVGMLGVFMLRL